MTSAKNSGAPAIACFTSSACTYTGRPSQNSGASFRATSSMIRCMAGAISGASASANRWGWILPNISLTSSSFEVIRSHRMAAIFPAFAGMMPCHPPSSPNGWPLGCANFSGAGVNSRG